MLNTAQAVNKFVKSHSDWMLNIPRSKSWNKFSTKTPDFQWQEYKRQTGFTIILNTVQTINKLRPGPSDSQSLCYKRAIGGGCRTFTFPLKSKRSCTNRGNMEGSIGNSQSPYLFKFSDSEDICIFPNDSLGVENILLAIIQFTPVPTYIERDFYKMGVFVENRSICQ